MNKAFYLNLAIDNIKKNKQTTYPYIFTSILSVLMFYITTSLANNQDLSTIEGGYAILDLLQFGSGVVAIFSLIFLFYTHSFLIKRRKKEFGLFNILGLEKKHLMRILFYESAIELLISLAAGVVLGIILDKAMYLSIIKMLDATLSFGFYISTTSIRLSVFLFCFIYFLIFLVSIFQIKIAKPIELLASDKQGEKEPKAKWLLSIIGIICLVSGYTLSITIKDPLSAFTFLFVAVILVIIGTYLLFTSISITILKLLKKNKRYYYQTSHFISVSNMIYRMKQNAVGLANICILSTMILVILSTTVSLWTGMEDLLHARYPKDVIIEVKTPNPIQIRQQIDTLIQKKGIDQKDTLTYSYLSFSCLQQGSNFSFDIADGGITDISNVRTLYFIPLKDYNKQTNQSITLNDDEVLFYGNRSEYNEEDFKIFNYDFKIKQYLDEFFEDGTTNANISSTYSIVVKDIDLINEIQARQQAMYPTAYSQTNLYYGFDTNDDQKEICEYISKHITLDETQWAVYDYKDSGQAAMKSLCGGFLFIGIFLSILFIMAAILIMYYKQISEGFQDKQRFEIMRKVGLETKDVAKTIRSQVLTVFFMPLILSGIHVCFAYPMFEKILKLLYLENETIFIYTTIACYIAFSLIYMIVYIATSRTYLKIVED